MNSKNSKSWQEEGNCKLNRNNMYIYLIKKGNKNSSLGSIVTEVILLILGPEDPWS